MLSASLIAPDGVASFFAQRNSAAGRAKSSRKGRDRRPGRRLRRLLGTQVLSLTVTLDTSASLVGPTQSRSVNLGPVSRCRSHYWSTVASHVLVRGIVNWARDPPAALHLDRFGVIPVVMRLSACSRSSAV